MKNWLAFILLIAAVMVIILYPGITNEIRMTILTVILVAIIGYLGYISYISLSKEVNTAEECNTCNGPPPQYDPCDECGINPCQCAQTLPGQTRCPKCDSSSLMPSLPGITSCSSCHRNYRCPGCLLK
jgi:hypothetical protein